ncbi:tetratricopeptide repeat protein [Sinorhizobium meliloti]|uniref:tetratricopeptide repeat protein n=1 Tax=Rhizobium meliloti TaxID=382 RepID=UPI0018658F0B
MTGSINDAEQAIKLDPRQANGHILRARIHVEQGYLADVKDIAQLALSLTPNSAVAHYYLALSLDRTGEFLEAEEAINRALELEPTNTDFKVLRARLVLRRDEDTDAALAEIDDAISREPDNARHHVHRGTLLWQIREPEEALAAAETALSLDGRLADAYGLRGKLLYDAGYVTEALADIKEALRLKPGLFEAAQLREIILAQARPKAVGASCDPSEEEEANALAESKFVIDATAARVGKAISLAWHTPPPSLRPGSPTYVVVLMPEEVRLAGSGFFGLAPGATGPYDMKYGRSKLRAIVPLHVANAPRSGIVTILPYRAGPLVLEWSIIQISSCGESKITASESASVDVEPGIPELVVRDEFATTNPISVITTTQRPYAAIAYPEFVEVVDKSTGETILQTPGTDPDFSPTGRFLVTGTPEADFYDVFDLVAARKLGRFHGLGLYWSDRDSFLFLDSLTFGEVSIVRTLHGERYQPRDSVVSMRKRYDDESAVKVEANEDIGPLSGASGLFVTGSTAWALELSVEAGIVALRNTWMENVWRDPDEVARELKAAPPEDDRHSGYVVDLTRTQANRRLNKKDLDALLARDYHIRAAILGWNVHGPLYQALIASGPSDIRTVPYFSQEEEIPEHTSPQEDTEGYYRTRGALSLATANINPLALISVAGARLKHLPAKKVERLRSGEDNDRLDAVSLELKNVIPKSAATIGEPSPAGIDNTPPFPDPSVPLDEPIALDLRAPGRDLWRSRAADVDFWLTQSVGSGRLAHSYQLSMIARGRDGIVRHADLLADAGEYLTKKEGKDRSDAFELFSLGDARGSLDETFNTPSAVTIFGDRYLMIATQPVPHLIAFDMREWRIVCAIPEPRNASNITSVAMHADLRHITQINKNGYIEVYSCAEQSSVLSGLYVDGELVVSDRSGNFEGSDDAAEYIELKIPGLPGRHLLSQFSGVLRRDGIAKRVLSGEKIAAAPRLDPPSLAVRLGDKRDKITFTVVARSNVGLQKISVYAGGRSVANYDTSGMMAELAVPVTIAGNSGIVTFVATDKAGIMSAPVEIVLSDYSAKRVGKLFAIAVGVNTYKGMPNSDLKFSVADAKRVVEIAKSTNLYRQRSITALLDGAASSASIISSIKAAVDKAGVDDTILVSFAGHGLVATDRSLRLALSDTNLEDLVATSLSFDDVLSALKGSRARVVVFLDVCHGGVANRSTVASNDIAASILTTASGSGIVILSASKGRQYSEETSLLRGGRFSTAIESTLGKNRTLADSDQNGRISLRELYRAVKASVASGSDGRQTPWIARNQVFGDFDLF